MHNVEGEGVIEEYMAQNTDDTGRDKDTVCILRCVKCINGKSYNKSVKRLKIHSSPICAKKLRRLNKITNCR